jgi:hypothetical protein
VHNNPLTYTDPSGWCGSLTCKQRNDGVRPEADTDGEYGGGSGDGSGTGAGGGWGVYYDPASGKYIPEITTSAPPLYPALTASLGWFLHDVRGFAPGSLGGGDFGSNSGGSVESVPPTQSPQDQEEDSDDSICNVPGLGGGGLTLRQRADLARLQGLGGVVGGAILGRVSGAVLGYGAALGYNAYNLRATGAWVQGGSAQGNHAYGAAARGLGLPLSASQRFAGFYEQYGPNSGGRYAPENGTFYGDPPYGDDPGAQQAIAEGYACGP